MAARCPCKAGALGNSTQHAQRAPAPRPSPQTACQQPSAALTLRSSACCAAAAAQEAPGRGGRPAARRWPPQPAAACWRSSIIPVPDPSNHQPPERTFSLQAVPQGTRRPNAGSQWQGRVGGWRGGGRPAGRAPNNQHSGRAEQKQAAAKRMCMAGEAVRRIGTEGSARLAGGGACRSRPSGGAWGRRAVTACGPPCLPGPAGPLPWPPLPLPKTPPAARRQEGGRSGGDAQETRPQQGREGRRSARRRPAPPRRPVSCTPRLPSRLQAGQEASKAASQGRKQGLKARPKARHNKRPPRTLSKPMRSTLYSPPHRTRTSAPRLQWEQPGRARRRGQVRLLRLPRLLGSCASWTPAARTHAAVQSSKPASKASAGSVVSPNCREAHPSIEMKAASSAGRLGSRRDSTSRSGAASKIGCRGQEARARERRAGGREALAA